jgi:hypothetical protein
VDHFSNTFLANSGLPSYQNVRELPLKAIASGYVTNSPQHLRHFIRLGDEVTGVARGSNIM